MNNDSSKATRGKPTKAEMVQRVGIIYRMILLGASNQDIQAYSAEAWGAGDDMADRYRRRASAILEKDAETDRKAQLGLALARREDLYKKNMKLQNYPAALSADKDRCVLLDLYPKQELAVAVTGEVKVGVLVLPKVMTNAEWAALYEGQRDENG
jgi:hypothetical protein